MMNLNRLDGWERLGMALGGACALAVAISAPFDESGTFTKGSDGAPTPWYGIALSSRVYAPPAPAPEVAAPAPAPEAAEPIQGPADKPSDTNRGPWTDDPPAELSDADIWGTDLYVNYLDTRVTALFMLLAGVLPYVLICVVRWVFAGFKQAKG